MSIKDHNLTEVEGEEGPEQEEQPVAVDTPDPQDTLSFKRSHFYAVMTVLAFAVGVLLGYVVWGFNPDGGQAQTAQAGKTPQNSLPRHTTKYF